MCLCLSTLTIKAQDTEDSGSGDEQTATATSTAKSYTLGDAYNCSVIGMGEVYLTYTQKNGQFLLTDKTSIDPTEYTGIRVVCSNPDNVKVKIAYETSADTEYDAVQEGSNTYSFKTTSGNITQITIYANEDVEGAQEGDIIASVTVNDVYLIKAGSEEAMDLTASHGETYGCEVSTSTDGEGETQVTSTTFTFSQAWGQKTITGEFDISKYSGYRIVCSNTPNNVQMKVMYEDGTQKNPSLANGTNTYTFETGCGNVTYVAIQSTNDWTEGDTAPIITEAVLLTNASEEEAVYPGTEQYNCSAEYSVTSVKYTKQWGQIVVKDGGATMLHSPTMKVMTKPFITRFHLPSRHLPHCMCS